MRIIQIYTLLVFLAVGSCSNNQNNITASKDYNHYLNIENDAVKEALSDQEFWLKKVKNNPAQYPYLSKLAASYSKLFKATGKIEYLILAEESLQKINERTNFNKPGYLKSLASNYISQHKFKEALILLKKCEGTGEHLQASYKMLFDIYLELGNVVLAETYLEKINKENDFDYLIRLSKWHDHQGNLNSAIKYLEKATVLAEETNMKGIKQWAYTNLADYYGHQGNIQASYEHYLKSLALDPNDAYALKGIAWIIYSYERNPDEALRILDAISNINASPDYHLLKAEIAEYKSDFQLKNMEMSLFNKNMKNTAYGNMYNKYLVSINLDRNEINIEKALYLSQIEINNRPTTQSYDLLAWTFFNDGKYKDALQIVNSHIVNKTYEPEALYHMAEIYKITGQLDKIKPIKEDLIASIYELGPLMEEKILGL